MLGARRRQNVDEINCMHHKLETQCSMFSLLRVEPAYFRSVDAFGREESATDGSYLLAPSATKQPRGSNRLSMHVAPVELRFTDGHCSRWLNWYPKPLSNSQWSGQISQSNSYSSVSEVSLSSTPYLLSPMHFSLCAPFQHTSIVSMYSFQNMHSFLSIQVRLF